ncbi:hypothetical protein EVAR_97111_1 [Eumeta japonica]|uniref:Uncharacterized protein n=1 Tax=Eumeta variegata TaxID=151549 RepID=A0A4C1WSL6_EUMVA|nr:hypothetical protein EVAR_97111_1 [Eumeta japonica]
MRVTTSRGGSGAVAERLTALTKVVTTAVTKVHVETSVSDVAVTSATKATVATSPLDRPRSAKRHQTDRDKAPGRVRARPRAACAVNQCRTHGRYCKSSFGNNISALQRGDVSTDRGEGRRVHTNSPKLAG